MADNYSTDIYEINELVDNIKKNFIEDQSEETLALSTYGYLGAVQSSIARSVLINVGEFANEVFPSKCKFDKNILMHAVSYNIGDINAKPGIFYGFLSFLESDIKQLMENNTLIIDHNCKFFIEEFEFHLDYDIIISRAKLSSGESIYTARYDISTTNKISNIINPYLQAPAKMKIDGKDYIVINCQMHQVSYTIIPNKLTSSNIIENKTYNFEFEDQLADFFVEVTDNGKTIRLIPLLEGININNEFNYCYYSYIDTNTIRVRFDSSSYIPGINTDIKTIIQTTKGTAGEFSYNKDLNIVLESDNISYRNAIVVLSLQTEVHGAEDSRSVSELKKLLPKEALAKGIYTTKQDLDNYFNMINVDNNKIEIRDRMDNQLGRSFYAYIVMKDDNNTVIPTNTIKLNIAESEFTSTDNGVNVIKQGSYILYDSMTKLGTVKQNPSQEEIEASDFIYTSTFLTVVNHSPLYVAYYMPLVDTSPILYFSEINANTPLTFISTYVRWRREFLTDTNVYKLNITITQNADIDMGMLTEIKNEDGDIVDIETNIRVICVLYNDGNVVYRYAEAELASYDLDRFSYEFQLNLDTNDVINEDNKIKINNVYNLKTTENVYGYFSSNIAMNIYILAKFDNDYARYDLDNYVPGLEGYSVCNIYKVDGGVDFFTNYSANITSFVTPTSLSGGGNGYSITGIPVVKYDYIQDESHIKSITEQLASKKLYIDAAIDLLENNFGIDFKFFNTYGPSQTYTLSDGRFLDRVDLTFRFKTKLFANVDKNTIDYIKRDIKDIVENINNISSIHMPNITTTIEKKYAEAVEYFEFLGFNKYGPGVQHLYRNELNDISIVPELVNIQVDKETLEPMINIEIEEPKNM